MNDEANLIAKRVAYIDTLRGLYRRERLIGFFMILAGVALVLAQKVVFNWPHILIWLGYGLLAAGWIIFVYVIWRRTAWRRANPFNPNS